MFGQRSRPTWAKASCWRAFSSNGKWGASDLSCTVGQNHTFWSPEITTLNMMWFENCKVGQNHTFWSPEITTLNMMWFENCKVGQNHTFWSPEITTLNMMWFENFTSQNARIPAYQSFWGYENLSSPNHSLYQIIGFCDVEFSNHVTRRTKKSTSFFHLFWVNLDFLVAFIFSNPKLWGMEMVSL